VATASRPRTISEINQSLDAALARFAQRRLTRALSLPDPRCPLREGPPRRRHPVPGGAGGAGHQLDGRREVAGRGTGEPRVRAKLEELPRPLGRARPQRRGVRRLRPITTGIKQAPAARSSPRPPGSDATCTSCATPSTTCRAKADRRLPAGSCAGCNDRRDLKEAQQTWPPGSSAGGRYPKLTDWSRRTSARP